MIRKFLVCLLFLFLLGSTFVWAQEDEDVDAAVDYKVNKMQTVLHLTETQAIAIRPIIKDYINKRNAFLTESSGQGIVDHVAISDFLRALKDTEHAKLGKILTSDQMQKWIDKENLLAALNPDSVTSGEDDDVTLTGEGANFKF